MTNDKPKQNSWFLAIFEPSELCENYPDKNTYI